MPCCTTWPRPPRAGPQGRPRLEGKRLGAPADLAANASWSKATVCRYGRHEQVWVAERRCLWYGAFGCQQVRVVLLREAGHDHGYDLALVTTDLDSPAADIVARYAARWSIEVAIFDGKQTAGVGQARNRTPKAVERTVRFGFYCLDLAILWYAIAGHTPEVVAERRRRAPWYAAKKNPSVAAISSPVHGPAGPPMNDGHTPHATGHFRLTANSRFITSAHFVGCLSGRLVVRFARSMSIDGVYDKPWMVWGTCAPLHQCGSLQASALKPSNDLAASRRSFFHAGSRLHLHPA